MRTASYDGISKIRQDGAGVGGGRLDIVKDLPDPAIRTGHDRDPVEQPLAGCHKRGEADRSREAKLRVAQERE